MAKKFEVTATETVAPGSVMETKVIIEADTQEEAIEKAKVPTKSRFGRFYVAKEVV